MARVLITGSVDGLGRGTAAQLLDAGHEVVVHARSAERARDFGDIGERAAEIVTGDLAELDGMRAVADQVNALGTMDAVIHNAGIHRMPTRTLTVDGLVPTFAVNAVAPYVLSMLVERPARLVYLSSDMHASGDAERGLADVDWIERGWSYMGAYSDSKLFVTTVALALARLWPDALVNAVDPGWVATKMGGPGAPDDFDEGCDTQAWLAIGDDGEAARSSGKLWRHRRVQRPVPVEEDIAFQDALLDLLARRSGVELRTAG